MFQKFFNHPLRRVIILTIMVMFVILGALPLVRAQAASSIKVQIDKGNGVDNTQETGFNFLVKNTGTAAVSGITVQIYFTPDGSNAASGYVLEKYYDQSGVTTISGPTLQSGSTYYFTVNYGTASLAAGGQWEFQTALHLSSWGSTYSGGNDYYHTGYAVGALPAAYTDTNNIPAYVSGTLAWGTPPGSTATNTFVPPTTTIAPPPTTVVPPPTTSGSLPDLVVTSITNAPSTVPCGAGWNPGTNVTVANQGTASAGAFTLSLVFTDVVTSQNISGLAAGASTTVRFNNNGGTFTATADSAQAVAESNENNNTLSKTLPVSDPIPCTPIPATPTKTNTPFGVTNTPVPPTKTNTTVPPTKTNTPVPTSGSGGGPCANPTIITSTSGSYSVTTGTTCFRYLNNSFVHGGMFSVMNGGSTATNTLNWYGGLDQNVTACTSQSKALSGNGAQLNNFSIAKDADGLVFLMVTGSTANTISISIQNWQNGAGCSLAPTQVVGGPTSTPFPTKTNTPVTNTPVVTPTVASTTVTDGHVSNAFVGATMFVNPFWSANVNAANITASQKATISKISTFVWLDSIDAVNGVNGYPASLSGYLDSALSQGANLIGIVLYDLPGRDCGYLAPHGELPATTAGLTTYETSYIDPIATTIGQAKYANLRVVAIVEPNSLPNLITNSNVALCATVGNNHLYTQGIQYALNKLSTLPNIYSYLDIGRASWLGFASNFTPGIQLYSNVVKGTTRGGASIEGFIDNTSNYGVITEPFMTATQTINGSQVKSATFFEFNDYIEEDTFTAAWVTAMQTAGLPPSNTKVIIDTSRNGWGGCGGLIGTNTNPCRPTGPSSSTDLNTFVNASRIDRRPQKGDWCNQNGAGLGNRPGLATGPYQAYVWVKVPGESDGSSVAVPAGTDNPRGYGFDRMCDPTYLGNTQNNNNPTNALANAPIAGRWFEAQFEQLVANSFPPIQ